jgi:hypothetical protein
MFIDLLHGLKFGLPVLSAQFFHLCGLISGSRLPIAVPHAMAALLHGAALTIPARDTRRRSARTEVDTPHSTDSDHEVQIMARVPSSTELVQSSAVIAMAQELQ